MKDLIYIIPEIILSIYALLALVHGVFSKNNNKASRFILTINSFIFLFFLYVLFFIEYKTKAASVIIMNGAFLFDHSTFIFKSITSIAAAIICIIALNNTATSSNQDGTKLFEFPILIVLSVIGVFLMISAIDLISIYLGLELSSLALYVMVALNRDNEKATEAGVKYFVLGALASGLFLYGASFLYGFSGTTNLEFIFEKISSFEDIKSVPPAFILGFVLLFTGLFFKLSLVPFHMWAPDVYHGSSKVVLSFLAAIPKIAIISVLLKFTTSIKTDIYQSIQPIFVVVAIASMLVGSFAALKQANIKRLIAYSGIANMGYLLIAVLVSNNSSTQVALVYIAIYLVATLGIFAILTLLKKDTGEELVLINDLSGFSKSHPYYASLLAIFMFSLAGIPPLSGFWGKFMIFKHAFSQNFYLIALIGVLTSVVSCFYYLKIIKSAFFDAVLEGQKKIILLKPNKPLKLFIFLAFIFNLFLFIYFDDFYSALQTSNLPAFE